MTRRGASVADAVTLHASLEPQDSVVPVPAEVQIGHYTYRVQVGGPEWDSMAESEEDYLYGRCIHSLQVIFLRPEMPAGLMRDTLLHEIMHACFFTAGDTLTRLKKHDLEEGAIRLLSHPLLGVMRDNPGLVEYLTA